MYIYNHIERIKVHVMSASFSYSYYMGNLFQCLCLMLFYTYIGKEESS